MEDHGNCSKRNKDTYLNTYNMGKIRVGEHNTKILKFAINVSHIMGSKGTDNSFGKELNAGGLTVSVTRPSQGISVPLLA